MEPEVGYFPAGQLGSPASQSRLPTLYMTARCFLKSDIRHSRDSNMAGAYGGKGLVRLTQWFSLFTHSPRNYLCWHGVGLSHSIRPDWMCVTAISWPRREEVERARDIVHNQSWHFAIWSSVRRCRCKPAAVASHACQRPQNMPWFRSYIQLSTQPPAVFDSFVVRDGRWPRRRDRRLGGPFVRYSSRATYAL